MANGPEKPWYHAGLKFTCTQCGNCCTGAPGYVYVSREEVEKIAAFIGRTDGWLDRQHLRRVGLRYSLTEDRRNGDCCFLKQENGKRICTIYPVRPLQCRTWPFWDVNLESSRDWSAAAKNCPGMNSGKHYDLVQIETRRDAERWEDVAP
jgi:Fe-S-cluster containining protein